MKTLGAILAVSFSVAVLAAIAAAGYFSSAFVLDLFATLDPQVAMIMAITSIVALFCSTIIASGFKWIGRKEGVIQVRAEKANLYEGIVLIWGEKLKQGTNGIDQAIEGELQKLERLLSLRGNSSVVKAYATLRSVEQESGMSSPEISSQVTKVLLEMRKDLALSVLNLNESDLVKLINVKAFRDAPSSPLHVGRPQVSLTRGA